jgi:aminoglycoside 6'-N-acetyltransferase I
MLIRSINEEYHDDWFRMRKALWPECPEGRLRAEMATILADESQAVFVAVRDCGGLGGFVEVSIHPHALGCETQHVGYLEGWWVDADLRRSGVGRELVTAAEEWARAKGCREMASDTDVGNDASISAHAALGYQQVGRVIPFTKRLD